MVGLTATNPANSHITTHTLHTVYRWLCGFLLALCCLSVQAETKLSASVDRNKVYEHDTINLTITGEVAMEFSFGGIMNFGRNQLDAPDMEALLNDFDILDQSQNYSMRSINGESKTQITWNYSIAPKRTGTLTIPAITYQGGSSQPISIEVNAGNAPRNADTPPLVFIEAEVDKQSAYVQEQVAYTLRLYSADHLATGDLSEPAPNDAIVESIGDTQKYYRMAYNQRYEVRERKYLLFPQKSGQLTIEPQSFNGMLINTRTRNRIRVREVSEAITLDIKPPPASYSGDIWLPATSFEMKERWDKEPYDLKVGDSVTRTLEISALGLLGSALPPLTLGDIPGLKIYPDQPLVESFEHDSGARSLRQETSALVAINATDVNLPEIRIPWWDTVNDVERIAIIPARPFKIAPNPDQPLAAPPAVSSSNQQSTLPAEPLPEVANFDTSTTSSGVKPEQGEAVIPAVNNQPWYLVITLLIIGWISTTWLLLKRQQRLMSQTTMNENQPAQSHYEALIKAIKSENPELPKYLVNWANEEVGNISNISDLKKLDHSMFEIAKDIETQLYSPNGNGTINVDKATLLKQIKTLHKVDKQKQKSDALQPMYP